MTNDIRGLVQRVVCEQFGVSESAAGLDTARLISDLGADSLDHIELCMALEDEFGIDITDEDAERFTNATISEIATAIGMHLAAKAS